MSCKLKAVEGLLAMAMLGGVEAPPEAVREVDEIYELLLFYQEHTLGAAESVRSPHSENSKVQWRQKAAYIWEAVKRTSLLQEQALGLLASTDTKQAGRIVVTVYNPLGWPRTGLAAVFIGCQAIARGKAFVATDEQGEPVKIQHLEDHADGSFWSFFVRDIPAMGAKKYFLEEKEQSSFLRTTSETMLLENRFYRLRIDEKCGGISSLVDRESGEELTDGDSPWRLGQILYEELSDREQLEAFTIHSVKRSSLFDVEIAPVRSGEIWQSLSIRGRLKGAQDEAGVACEIRLFNEIKRLELHYRLIKEPVLSPEALYVAFPFALSEGELCFEAQGGVIVPGRDQLPGTASDWNTVQNFVAVRNKRRQIVLCSPQTPLMQLGGLNIGRFDYHAAPKTTHIYSWVLNNYWTTNFKASQEGELRWSYIITTGPPDDSFAMRFGMGSRTPMPVRVAVREDTLLTPSLFHPQADNVLLINARPALRGRAIVMHLREVDGKKAGLDVSRLTPARVMRAAKTDVLEQELLPLSNILELRPYESCFVKLWLANEAQDKR